MYCNLGGNYCGLSGFALAPASIRIIHGGQTYDFTGTFSPGGYFGVAVEAPNGVPVYLNAYDRVSGTGVAQYGLPNLTANLNYTANMISGKVPAYRYFNLRLEDIDTWGSSGTYAQSNGTGTYSVNSMTALSVDLLAGHPYVVQLEFTLPNTGNRTILIKAFGP